MVRAGLLVIFTDPVHVTLRLVPDPHMHVCVSLLHQHDRLGVHHTRDALIEVAVEVATQQQRRALCTAVSVLPRDLQHKDCGCCATLPALGSQHGSWPLDMALLQAYRSCFTRKSPLQ
jgi:hypothetical protein